MTDRRSNAQTRKRLAKALQEEFWDCSVCTYRNSPEAFKCSVCDVRKGTSTRKPRLNQQIVAQQEATRLVAQVPSPPPTSRKEADEEEGNVKREAKAKVNSTFVKSENTPKSRQKNPRKRRLKGVDRSDPIKTSVTAKNKTIVFTEYRLKKPSRAKVAK